MKLTTILLLAGGAFAVVRVTSSYKFEVGQLVGVTGFAGIPYYFTGTVTERRKGIFSNQYLVNDVWYDESRISATI